MIFSQYAKTYMVLVDYPTIRGQYIKYHFKKAISNPLHTNIDVQIRRLISELPTEGVNCISKLQYHCANMNFYEKIRYDRLFQLVTHKGGESAMNYINRLQN